MANYNGSLEAVDCHIHNVRTIWCECEPDVVSDVSSGHLRRGSDADTTKKGFSRTNDASILSWPTIMGL
eukprot:scaffold22764_cov189-Skeletonema_dohrnii-CCMP3373.AAC.1